MGKKSILTPVLSVVLAVTILATGFIVGFKGGFFGKEKEEKTSEVTEFQFDGLNDALSYASADVSMIYDILSGKIDKGMNVRLSMIPGEAAVKEAGLSYMGTYDIVVDAKAKGGISAADVTVNYDGSKMATVNISSDGENAYFRIPELSDAYLKGSVTEFFGNNAASFDMPEQAAEQLPEEVQRALDNFDKEKCSELIDKYSQIIIDDIPQGKSNGKTEGDINGIAYSYDRKTIKITPEDLVKIMTDVINEAKTDKDIEELYDSVMSSPSAIIDTEVTEENEIPDYKEYCDMLLDELKEIDTSSEEEEELYFDLLYDGDTVKGIAIDADGDNAEVVMVDEKDEFAVLFRVGDEEVTELKASVKGQDGKYDASFGMVSDNGEEVTLGASTDIEVVDEETGSFSGTVEFFMTADDQTLKVTLDSDSTADKADYSLKAVFDDEELFTYKLEAVETNASDVTLPTGKIYDMLNDEDMEEYSANCDYEGFENSMKDIMGEELYEYAMENSSMGSYLNKKSKAELSSMAKSVFVKTMDAAEKMSTIGRPVTDGVYGGYIYRTDFVPDFSTADYNTIINYYVSQLAGEVDDVEFCSYRVIFKNCFPETVVISLDGEFSSYPQDDYVEYYGFPEIDSYSGTGVADDYYYDSTDDYGPQDNYEYDLY